MIPDRGCVHGGKHGPAVYIFSAGCPEEQSSYRGPAADTVTGDESPACTAGMYMYTQYVHQSPVWHV